MSRPPESLQLGPVTAPKATASKVLVDQTTPPHARLAVAVQHLTRDVGPAPQAVHACDAAVYDRRNKQCASDGSRAPRGPFPRDGFRHGRCPSGYASPQPAASPTAKPRRDRYLTLAASVSRLHGGRGIRLHSRHSRVSRRSLWFAPGTSPSSFHSFSLPQPQPGRRERSTPRRRPAEPNSDRPNLIQRLRQQKVP